MSEAIKIIHMVGTSEKGFTDAIKSVLHKASKTIDNITGIEVLNQTCIVEKNEIVEFHVDMHIAFVVESKGNSSRKDSMSEDDE